MTDQTPESTDGPESQDPGIFAGPDHAAAKAAVDTILTLDEILSAATTVTRTVRLCMRPDLAAEYEGILKELRTLVDGEGNPINDDGDEALNSASRATELQARGLELLPQIRAAEVPFRFDAMPPDEWDAFEKTHRTGSDNHLKDEKAYEEQLIAKCAVAPAIDVPGVRKLRAHKSFNKARINTLFNAAYFVNTADGIDVPKSPSYLHAPRPQES